MSINWVYVRDFAAVGDGITDDAAAIRGAIAAAANVSSPARPAIVWFDPLEYAIGSTLDLGNGSVAQFSTINNIELRGQGAPYTRLSDGSPDGSTGTRLKWIGPTLGTMIRMLGPCQGFRLTDIALNGAPLSGPSAAICLSMTSASRVFLSRVTLARFSQYGLMSTTVAADTIPVGTGTSGDGIGCDGLFLEGLRVAVPQSATGIYLTGWTGRPSSGSDPGSDGSDTTRVQMTNTFMILDHTSATGMRFGYTDQITIQGLYMSCSISGTQTRSSTSIAIEGTPTLAHNYPFPQNIKVVGDVDIGQGLPISVTGTPGGGIYLERMTLLDSQVIPRDPVSRFVSFSAFDYGTFPKGGFWADGGLSRQNVGVSKNRILNSTFAVAKRGTTFNLPASGASILVDGTYFFTDSSNLVGTVTRTPFLPIDQVSVPYEPQYLLDINVTSCSSGTAFYVGWKIYGVRTFIGRYATFSAWLNSSVNLSVMGHLQQYFGAGDGTRSTFLTVPSELSGNPGMSWRREAYKFLLPNVPVGTLVSTANDDYIVVWLQFQPSPGRYRVTQPQFEGGEIDTSYETPDPAVNEAQCARILQLRGRGDVGSFASPSIFTLGGSFSTPMRVVPTAYVVGTVSIESPGYVHSSPTSAPALNLDSVSQYGFSGID